MKKLYAVRVSSVAMVWAGSASEAVKLAQLNADSIVANGEGVRAYEVLDREVQLPDLAAHGWTKDMTPWGGTDRCGLLLALGRPA